MLVKSVSLDDDNLTAVNVKPNLERSSSSALVEKKTPEKTTAAKEQPKTKEENPKSTIPVKERSAEKEIPKEVKVVEEEKAPSAPSANFVEPSTPSGQNKLDKPLGTSASTAHPLDSNTHTGRSSPDYFDALDTLDIAQSSSVKEEYTVVSRKKKKKPESRDAPFSKSML